MIYGHENTIHRSGHLDVEVDAKGQVVAVWYRCLALPFKAHVVDEGRAHEMRMQYDANPPDEIAGVETGL
jgi:hypothetical protein